MSRRDGAELPEQERAAVLREQDEAWAEAAARVGAEIDRQVPGVYSFAGYGVED